MTKEELRAVIVEELTNIAPEAEIGELRDNDDLREVLDLDSMDIFNLVIALSRRLETNIPDADAAHLVTLAKGAAYLEERVSNAR